MESLFCYLWELGNADPEAALCEHKRAKNEQVIMYRESEASFAFPTLQRPGLPCQVITCNPIFFQCLYLYVAFTMCPEALQVMFMFYCSVMLVSVLCE